MTPDRGAARRAVEGGAAIDRDLWRQLVEAGLIGAVLPSRLGGSEVGLSEEVVITEVLARAVAPAPVVTVFLAAHVLSEAAGEAAERLARALASGEQVIGVALSADCGLPPHIAVRATGAQARITGEISDAVDGAALDVFLVPAEGRWWAVDASAEGVEREELRTLDLDIYALASVSFRDAPAIAVSVLDGKATLSIAWTLLAAEGLGVAQAALDPDYPILSPRRRQFGELIGRFPGDQTQTG